MSIKGIEKVTPQHLNKYNIETIEGDMLEISKYIGDIVIRIKEVLNKNDSYDINLIAQKLIIKALMLEKLFGEDVKLIEEEQIKLNKEEEEALLKIYSPNKNIKNNSGIIPKKLHKITYNNVKNNIENDEYYAKPIIGVFYNHIPLFLNGNYMKALGAKDLKNLKDDIKSGTYLEKYYTKKSAIKAKEAIKRLEVGLGYKNLVLETKDGKLISWNSYGSIGKGFEVRIGNDISFGKHQQEENNNKFYEGISFNTLNEVGIFIKKVELIISISKEDKNTLLLFGFLSQILDTVWNKGQYLMNIINENKIIINPKYAKLLNISKEHVNLLLDGKNKGEIDYRELWKDKYSQETLQLIGYLIEKELGNRGYYSSIFHTKDIKGNDVTHYWVRYLLSDPTNLIKSSFGIGTNTITKSQNDEFKFIKGDIY